MKMNKVMVDPAVYKNVCVCCYYLETNLDEYQMCDNCREDERFGDKEFLRIKGKDYND